MVEGIDRSPVIGMTQAWMRAIPSRLARAAPVVATRSRVVVACARGWARALARDARGRLPAWAARLTHERAVALLATALSIGACAWYAAHSDTLAYKDAVSHMMIARRVLFSPTPGLGQLGSVWPPFNHVLMLPFVWIDPLYRSGLAGAIPSMVGYILGTLYLFRAARLLFSSAAAGWVAALIFALNPNTLYLQSTPMSELVLLGLLLLGLYYLIRWVADERPVNLVACAGAFAAGSLVRYDVWALALAELAVIAYVTWRRHGWKAAEGALWLYGALAFAGCAAWFLYNWLLFADPLYFIDGPYSASYQQGVIKAHNSLPTYHNAGLAALVYLQAASEMVGWPLLVVAALATALLVARSRLDARMLPAYMLWSLLAFNILCLFLGVTVVYTPELHLANAPALFNVRYGIMALPEVALFTASLIAWRREALWLGLALALVFSGFNPALGLPYTLRDPLATSHWPTIRSEAAWLDQHYHGGTILIGSAPFTAVVFATDLPDHDFVNENTPQHFDQIIAAPQRYATWIVMDSGQASAYDAVEARLAGRTDWRQYYVLRTTIDGVQFYERIGSE